MKVLIILQRFRNAPRQFDHVLRIVQDRQPLAMSVRSNAIQPFQHFVAFQCDAATPSVCAGKQRTPNRVGVQNCRGISAADYL